MYGTSSPRPVAPAPRPFEAGPPVIVRSRGSSDLLVERGLVPLYRGRWTADPANAHAVPTEAHRATALALIAAVDDATRTPHWFCQESAALLWGCATVSLSGEVHLSQLHKQQRGCDSRVRRHSAVLGDDERTTVDDVAVTTLARTVVDCARDLAPRRAIVIADSALRQGLAAAELDEALRRAHGSRGVRRARDIVGWADGGAESPGESLVRLAALQGGLPRPQTQVPIDTHAGRRYGDIGWAEHRVVVEFDGRVKYTTLASNGAEVALVAERRRQDAIEEAGWLVIRVTWDDLADPVRLVARLRAALRRARTRAHPSSQTLSARS